MNFKIGINSMQDYYRLKDLIVILKLSRSTINKMLKNNNFPKPFVITGTNIRLWNHAVIDDWLRNQFKTVEG